MVAPHFDSLFHSFLPDDADVDINCRLDDLPSPFIPDRASTPKRPRAGALDIDNHSQVHPTPIAHAPNDQEVCVLYSVNPPERLPQVSKKGTNALLIGPIQYASYIRDIWPTPTSSAVRTLPVHMDLYQKVKLTNLPNYLEARRPIPSDLNCDAWDYLLEGYPDSQITQFLRFGWPGNFTAEKHPTSSNKNHPSATAYMADIDRFIKKELEKGALLGPFRHPPFQPWFQVSPLMTAEKKDSVKRRVIIDLSFPVGQSVNDGVAPNFFQGHDTSKNSPQPMTWPSLLSNRAPAVLFGRLIWRGRTGSSGATP